MLDIKNNSNSKEGKGREKAPLCSPYSTPIVVDMVTPGFVFLQGQEFSVQKVKGLNRLQRRPSE